MLKEFALSLKTMFLSFTCALLITAQCGLGNAWAAQAPADQSQELMPTEEVVEKLAEVTRKLTTIEVRYDPTLKLLSFTEELETKDRAAGKVGELQVHLDRVDPKRISYEPYTGYGNVLISGERLAGQVVFHCREGERCIRRGLRDAATPTLVGEPTDEASFRIDIVDRQSNMGDLRWFAALVQHLVTISSTTVQLQRTP